MNQLLYIDLQKKTIRVVGGRKFLAEYTFDDLSDIDEETMELIRTNDYSKEFVQEETK